MAALRETVFIALVSVGILALSGISASAAIVCNGDACWHTHQMYEYPPDAGVVVHPDTWRWGPNDRYVWREHEGRGYWHGDRWMEW
jgi:hypothetical protein